MNTERRSPHRIAISLFLLLAGFSVVAGQAPTSPNAKPRPLVQSELDYLRAAKLPISIELTQVTIRQAYDEIAKKAELRISYEGAVSGDSKHDLSFKNIPLKDILDKLGETFKLSYRAEGPDKLTVIRATSR